MVRLRVKSSQVKTSPIVHNGPFFEAKFVKSGQVETGSIGPVTTALMYFITKYIGILQDKSMQRYIHVAETYTYYRTIKFILPFEFECIFVVYHGN